MSYPMKAEPSIKPDPDAAASPMGFADEDIYEDTHDLEFNSDEPYQKLYLARVPKYLWEEWSKLDDDAEINLGTVRELTVKDSKGVEKTKLQMLLRSDLSTHQRIPKEYALDVTAESVNNTFVFTEANVPGYKSRGTARTLDPRTANMPARLTRPKPEYKPGEKQPFDKNRKWTPYFRAAIPKKTVLKGTVKHEVNCVPMDNEETRRIIALRTAEAMRAKTGTYKLTGAQNDITNTFNNPGTVQADKLFKGFIKTTAPTKAKAQENKTARMPRNELMDMLWACFRRYKYWSMKALRAELKQPEAYLREVLDDIADLPKSGKFAMNWTLKPDYATQHVLTNESEGAAPTADIGGDGADDGDEEMADGDDEDDDADVKFEDV